MTEDLIERYLTQLRDHLPMTGAYRTRILEETRDHLEQNQSELESTGMTADAAMEEAIAALGPPSEFAQQFEAAATRRTRLLAALAACGALVGLGVVRLSNTLHAEGERLGADLRYSIVWTIGLVSAAAVAGLMLAIVLRLGPRRLEVRGAAVAAVLAFFGFGAFHLANDGTFERGPDANALRLIALGAAATGSMLLLAAIRRTGQRLERGVWLITVAALLLVSHYTVLNQDGPVALVAIATLAAGCVWMLGSLVRERHLA